MHPDPVVSVRNLSHFFGVGDARAQVLFDINLDLARGEFVILRGASGSGKTTLLTLMACLRDVQVGDVTLLAHHLRGAREDDLITLRRQLGFIFQAHNLHESLTAAQNVRMGLELHGKSTIAKWEAATAHILTLLGLGARLDYLPANLSGGQKQRVAVARALVANPAIVFADEPTASLDEESGRTVVQMLKDLGRTRGTATLMITHDARVIDMADRVLVMENGRIIA
jgi:putative ABC transport system ATP-binding protein